MTHANDRAYTASRGAVEYARGENALASISASGVADAAAVSILTGSYPTGASIQIAAQLAAYDADYNPVWSGVRDDATRLEANTGAASLASLPLWPHGAPHKVQNQLNLLNTTLNSRPAEHWAVWTNWYEARLRGEPGNEEEEIARVLDVTEDEWNGGPAIANKKIKDIVARFRNTPLPRPSGLLESHSTPSVAEVPTAFDLATRNPITSPAPRETGYIDFTSLLPDTRLGVQSTARAPVNARLFISHATQADGARALALTRDLETAGIRCWIAPRDIPSGADWNGAILSAIESCEVMILLASDAAIGSRSVQAEVQHAFERHRRVFLIRLADSIAPEKIDIRLKTVQHIDGRGEVQTIVASILKSLA